MILRLSSRDRFGVGGLGKKKERERAKGKGSRDKRKRSKKGKGRRKYGQGKVGEGGHAGESVGGKAELGLCSWA